MKKRINLNFGWFFNPQFQDEHLHEYQNVKGFTSVDIPHSNVIIPYNNFNEEKMQTVSTYKKIINIPADYEGKIIEVIFEGSAHMSTIYINDEFVTVHKGGYDRFTVDISDYVKFGKENVLTVIVDATENKNIPPFGSLLDFVGYGGIYREVYLEVADKGRIIDCFFRTPNASNSITAFCDVVVDHTPIELELTVLDKGNVISLNRYNINRECETIDFDINDRVLWDITNPYLYDVKVKIFDGSNMLDERDFRFGFREVEINKNGVVLNGKTIKVIGMNHFLSYPYVGMAMPKSVIERDVEILKEQLGINAVRIPYTLPSPHFLNRCDEVGLLVFEEIPSYKYVGEADFKNNTLANISSMIKRDFNHPSVIAFGTRINAPYPEKQFLQETKKNAQKFDQTRPTYGITDAIDNEVIEEIFAYNDYEHLGKITRAKKTPHLISEHTGYLLPVKRTDSEELQTKLAIQHLTIIDQTLKNDNICGALGYTACDYNTHSQFGSPDKVAYHGVLDMFRLPKLASKAIRSQKENEVVLEVSSNLSRGDYQMRNLDKVYVFTNCEYVKLFKNDQYVATYYPDKKAFPHLLHPPVIIDDLIGLQLVKYDMFKEKDAKFVKKIFATIDSKGSRINIFRKMEILYICFKYHMKRHQFLNLYNKYRFGIANQENKYRFDGYINENVIKSVTRSPSTIVFPHLNVDQHHLEVKETYEATRAVITILDQNKTIAPYANCGAQIEVSGGIDLIGPSLIAVTNGAAAFWVKTNQKEKYGLIKVKVLDQELLATININYDI